MRNELDKGATTFTIPKPHDYQKKLIQAQNRFMVANCGRRAGKSTAAFLKVLLEAMEKQGNYFIVAPTYRQAEAIYWEEIVKVIVPKALMEKKDEQKLMIRLPIQTYDMEIYGKKILSTHDENKPASTIHLKGVENPDSLRGVKLRGCVMDEFAFMENGMDAFRKIIRPALADQQGWCLFISTPNGIHNDFYDLTQLAQENENYFFTKWTAKDNPYFPNEEWEEARAEHINDNREEEWNQEWLAEFTNPASLVYKQFNRETHVFKDPNFMPEDGVTHCLSVDFGWTDPLATVFVKIDADGNWYIYDEVYETEMETDKAVNAIKMKMGDDHFTTKLGDSAKPNEIADFGSKGLKLKASKKGHDSVQAGIRLVQGLLRLREDTGKPKLYVAAWCRNTIREFESYSRMKDRQSGDVLETPEDKNNHCLDALRYLALKILRPPAPKAKARKIYDPVTGRLLRVERQPV